MRLWHDLRIMIQSQPIKIRFICLIAMSLALPLALLAQQGFETQHAGMTVELRPSSSKPKKATGAKTGAATLGRQPSAKSPTGAHAKPTSKGTAASSASKESSKPGKERGYSLCVTSDGANLHSEPSADAPVSWKVGKFMPFKKVETQGGWLKVTDLEKKEHWVARSIVSHLAGCAVVSIDRAPLYKTPEPSGPKSEVGAAEKYMPYKIVGKHGPMTQVQDQIGEKFWISTAALWTP